MGDLKMTMRSFSTFFLLTFLVAGSTAVWAQRGVIKESISLESEILGKEVEYSVYLPPGYNETNRRYPVLYLLHGFTDDETAWTQFGEVQSIADREMKKVEVTPMIIVTPDAGVSWYINNYDRSVRYEDFFVHEFIPYIDQTYRSRPEKQFRAISGLSMGGYGTMIYAVKHPGLFAAAAPLSAGISRDKRLAGMSMENWNNVYGPVFGHDLEGEERLTGHYRDNSVLDLVATIPADSLKTVGFYIDCGDDDFLINGNMQLHSLMLERSIPHEFRVRDGRHTWSYWRSALPDVLAFVSKYFHR